MKKEDIIKITEVSFVLVVASAMYIYGFVKHLQFDNPSEVTKSVAEMTGMELMWAFYGYSKPYAILLGILEITGGTLLLIRKNQNLRWNFSYRNFIECNIPGYFLWCK